MAAKLKIEWRTANGLVLCHAIDLATYKTLCGYQLSQRNANGWKPPKFEGRQPRCRKCDRLLRQLELKR